MYDDDITQSLPTRYYYLKKNSEIQYSSEQTDNPNVNRMINGQEYWPKKSSTTREKKTLILNDWTAEAWTYDKIATVKSKIKELLTKKDDDEGFKFYIWQDTGLKVLTLENLDNLDNDDYRMDITPAFNDDLLKALATEGLSQKQVLFLDTSELEDLLSARQQSSEHLVKLRDITQSYHDPNLIYRIIEARRPPPPKILQTILSEDSLSESRYIKKRFPKLKVEISYKKIKLDTENQLKSINKLFATNSCEYMGTKLLSQDFANIVSLECSVNLPQKLLAKNNKIKILSLNDCSSLSAKTLKNISLMNLKSLEIWCGISFKHLQILLTKAKKLNSLELYEGSVLDENNLGNICLKHLESLRIEDSNIAFNQLQALISKTEKLKVLKLLNCNNLLHESLKNFNFKHLELLHIKSHAMNFSQLQMLLAENLNTLTLEVNLCFGDETQKNINFKLKHLQYLHIDGTISSKQLQALLANTGKLKTLKLFRCKYLSIGNLGNINLGHLESLDSDVPFKQLQPLLIKTKILKILKLHNCTGISRKNLENINLTHLESLEIREKTSSEQLLTLLGKTEKLKILKVYNCSGISKKNLVNINLKYLEALEIREKTSAEQLLALLGKTEKLKILKVYNCSGISRKTLKNINLKHLEALEIREKTSAEQLLALLGKTEKLKILKVYDCSGISRKILENINLKHLQSLEISGKFSSEQLHALLEKTENLKKLTLHDCSGISKETLKNINPDHLLHLNVEHSNITLEQFKLLLFKFKNLVRFNMQSCEKLLEKMRIDCQSLDIDFFREACSDDSNSLSTSLENRKTLDADTKDTDNGTYHLERIFYPLDESTWPPHYFHPRNYRIGVFNKIIVNEESCKIDSAFYLENKGDPKLVEPEINKCHEDVFEKLSKLSFDKTNKFIYGKQQLRLNREFQAIASLSANETMTHFHINTKEGIELQYSERDHLYYIKTTSDKPVQVSIDFIIKIPKNGKKLNQDNDELVKGLASKYKKFTAGPLIVDKTNPSGRDYLRYIETQQKGACRHRAIAFKAQLNNKSIPSRVITNGCHSYLELIDTGKKYDPDGYPADIKIGNLNRPSKKKIEEAHKALKQISMVERYKKRLTNRQGDTTEMQKSLLALMQELVSLAGEKHLIKSHSNEELRELRYQLQKYCKEKSKPLFYINSAKDIDCSSSSAVVSGTNNLGEMKKGPSGRLYDFLIKYAHKSPLIIVNHNRFSAEDIVGFNGLLGDTRYADGTKIPEKAIILSLYNPHKPGAYNGSDFTSRFNSKENLNLKPGQLTLHKKPIYFIDHAPKDATTIDLYLSNNWRQLLLGHWIIKGTQLIFNQGPLLTAIKKGGIININNGPWRNQEFQLFWQQAFLYGEFEFFGKTFKVHPDFKIHKTQIYDWKNLIKQAKWNRSEYSSQANILNPGLFTKYFTQHTCDNKNETLVVGKGILEAHKNQRLNIYLTHDLDTHDWARLLTECGKHNIRLDISCATGVSLPKELKQTLASPQQKESPTFKPRDLNNKNTCFVYSNDIDMAIVDIRKHIKQALVIDISECHASDLLTKIDIKFDKKSSELNFSDLKFRETEHVVLRALEEGKKIILKGNFSKELINKLAPLILHRSKNAKAKGKLILISSNGKRFRFISGYKHKTELKTKKDHLVANYGKELVSKLNHNTISEQPLVKLNASLRHLKLDPNAEFHDAWRGLESIPHIVREKSTIFGPPTEKTTSKSSLTSLPSKAFANKLFSPKVPIKLFSNSVKNLNKNSISNEKNAIRLKECETKALAFVEQRIKRVGKALESSPFVILAGVTGVGKTVFMDKFWRSKKRTVYFGIEQIKKWALDKTPGTTKTLFIDEANISSRDWSEFEGLFNNPPGILIDGKYHPLTNENDKNPSTKNQYNVVFSINPKAYSDDRSYPSLFKRHANSLVFNPMSDEYIYHFILQKAFEKTPLGKYSFAISRELLRMYDFLCDCSTTNILISPRELSMMAMLTVSYCASYPDADPIDAAKFYARNLSKALVPDNRKNEFDSLFKPIMLHRRVIIFKDDSFIQTQSRISITQQINDFLKLRDLRQKNAYRFNPVQKSSGLGGIIIEGEPGIGKSKLIIQCLQVNGLRESNYKAKNTADNIYYVMPVSMQITDKEELLVKAFYSGIPVVIDEINSSPMMESLLNDLLMGRVPPRFKKDKVIKPGFLILGGQNEIDMGGREPASQAILHRILPCKLAPYTRKETIIILCKKGLDLAHATALTKAYFSKREDDQQNHTKNRLCFRDLLEEVKLIVGEGKQHTTSSSKKIQLSSDKNSFLKSSSMKPKLSIIPNNKETSVLDLTA